MFSLANKPIDSAGLRDAMDRPRAGGFVFFEGRIRDTNEGKAVSVLEYEAYPELAEKEGARILEEAAERWEILDARVEHRIGRLEIGETAVWVGVAAAHRADAFGACQYIIDALKERVPIWKKEHYRDSSTQWIRGGG